MYIPPPPGYKPVQAKNGGGGGTSRTDGPGLGFFFKGALIVAGIFGVASVVTGVANTAHEVRRTVRG
jgi:hypothetical protein